MLVAFVALTLIMLPTVEALVSVWSESRTYNHGFVILPIALWLVWQKRGDLVQVVPKPFFFPLLGVALFACFWLVSRLIGVQVTEQLAFVGMLIFLISGVLGWRLSIYLAFPLLFLVFAVPMGEELVPPMMDFTAAFTVEAIRLTGIPVYREGLWFVLPTGTWSVVEACSGIRYVIASVTLGFLYAYVSYHALWKRLLFIALSAVLPVLANGLRAYGIVLIGHYSDMQLAVGVDHLVYGWVFFGFVMLLLFWLGGFWAEEHPPIDMARFSHAENAGHPMRQVLVAAIGVLMAFSAQAFYAQVSKVEPLTSDKLPSLNVGEWQTVQPANNFVATHQPTGFLVEQTFANRQGELVNAFMAFYPYQRQGYEAIAKQNALVRLDTSGEQIRRKRLRQVNVGSGSFEVNERSMIRKNNGEQQNLLVWQWYRVAGTEFSNPYLGKLYEIWARIVDSRSDGAWIAISTPLEVDGTEQAAERLAGFLNDFYPQATRSMDDVVAVDR